MITIIIPVFNTERYLARCIESVKRQSYSEWELLLIDDGSTDSSGEICETYGEQDERIKTYHTQNQGPAAARAYGVEHAKGELIMFIDSDDWVDTRILEILKRQMDMESLQIACCIFKNVDAKGHEYHVQKFNFPFIDCMTAEDCIYHMHHTRYLSGSPCTKLYRKELFKEIDFCENVTIGEDYAMVLQLVEKAKRVRIISRELYNRYVRKESISHGGFSNRHKDAFDNYMTIRKRLVMCYPAIAADIIAFHTEYEMAVLTAMCRNDTYDKEIIHDLKMDLRENMSNTIMNTKIPLYMKGCAFMIAYFHPLFIFLFRILNRLTGR